MRTHLILDTEACNALGEKDKVRIFFCFVFSKQICRKVRCWVWIKRYEKETFDMKVDKAALQLQIESGAKDFNPWYEGLGLGFDLPWKDKRSKKISASWLVWFLCLVAYQLLWVI